MSEATDVFKITDRTRCLTMTANESATPASIRCRGRVINTAGDVVSVGYPHVLEYMLGQEVEPPLVNVVAVAADAVPLFDTIPAAELKAGYVPMVSHEGTVVRAFNYLGRWHFTTMRVLNANMSRWVSPMSFGTQLEYAVYRCYVGCTTDGIQPCRGSTSNPAVSCSYCKGGATLPTDIRSCFMAFTARMDIALDYLFLVRSLGDNCRVNFTRHPVALVLAVIDRLTGIAIDPRSTDTRLTLAPLPRVAVLEHAVRDIGELRAYLRTSDYRKEQGVMYLGLKDRSITKFYSEEYHRRLVIRGNSPFVRDAYLELLVGRGPYDPTIATFREMFVHHAFQLSQLDVSIAHAAYIIYTYYVKTKIHHERIAIHPMLWKVITTLHAWHSDNRRMNLVTMVRVRSTILQLTSGEIYAVLAIASYANEPIETTTTTRRSTDNHRLPSRQLAKYIAGCTKGANC